MSYLELSGLAKRYPGSVAVDDVSLSVSEGEAVALLGPSGCGKTTTLRMLAGLVRPDAGAIRLGGRDITGLPAHRRDMGYVFQSYALFPHLTVARNVAFGLEERRLPRAEIAARVADALATVRLDALGGRKPRELSGGQQQRVALARALVIRPAVLLLDESLSNLDSRLRDAMRHEIRAIQRALGITTVFVTHDQVEAMTTCDRVAVMERGRVAQVGTPEDIYERPQSRFVAGFVGRVNVLATERDGAGRLTIWGEPLPLPAPPGPVDAFVRPGRVRLLPPSEPVSAGSVSLPGRIVGRVFVGDHVELAVEGAGGGRLVAELPSGAALPAEGEAVQAVWAAGETRLFPREAAVP